MSQPATNPINPTCLLFSALGSERRMYIVGLLAEKARKPKELSRRLKVSVPSISRHLQILQHAGMVERQVTGRGVVYNLKRDGLVRSFEMFQIPASKTSILAA